MPPDGMLRPAARPLTPGERLDWLRLARSEGVGPVSFFRLIERYRSAGKALEALPELSRRGGRSRPLLPCPRERAEAELERLDGFDARLIAWIEPDYPERLAAIDDPPPVLTVRGDAVMLGRRAVAMVGARNASASGRRLARDIAADLGRHGVAVASGLARGIDTAAHLGSLESGTIAVVAGGIEVIYPSENARLYDEIVARGAVVAELPAGTEPQARHFPRRNRLISGLSLGVVVVEAAPRSGSLITSRFALEQGREVFAVPGSPLDPRCRGTNQLLREGATLTESAEDVLRVLDEQRPPVGPRPAARGVGQDGLSDVRQDKARDEPAEDELSEARREIAERLGPTPVTVDELVRQCQLSPAVALTVLLELDLAGRLEWHPGKQVSAA